MEDSKRYKWSPSATNLLVTIWCHDLVQKQLKMSTRNQPIWESIARYMSRKGYSVTGLQCKTRIKNMLCNYHESVRKNEVTESKPYFEIFKKVLRDSSKQNKKGQDTEGPELMACESIESPQEQKEENDNELDSNNIERNPILAQDTSDEEYQMEFLDIANNECQSSINLVDNELDKFQNAILQAIEKQTQAITSAINNQSEMIKKLLTAERDQFENRKQFEMKLIKVLEKLEASVSPHMSYVGPILERTSPE